MLNASEPVVMVIADISGYTRYLGETELEHAENVLSDLLETVVGRLGPALKLLAVEGDAAFTFATSTGLDPSLLLDIVDACYAAFRRRQRNVAAATSCTCDACSRIPTLDLKFVVHAGQAVRSRVGGIDNLTGPAVITVHRLLKNSVKEELGLVAYALFTAEAVTALGLDRDALGLVPLTIAYEDIGPIEVLVLDLEPRWQTASDAPPLRVTRDEADMVMEYDLRASPSLVWSWLTVPEKRMAWGINMTGLDEMMPSGRRGPGMTNHCAHGPETVIQDYIEWRPFDLVTADITVPMLGTVRMTYELVPTDDVTHLAFITKLTGGPEQAKMAQLILPGLGAQLGDDYQRLVQMAEADAAGAPLEPPAA